MELEPHELEFHASVFFFFFFFKFDRPILDFLQIELLKLNFEKIEFQNKGMDLNNFKLKIEFQNKGMDLNNFKTGTYC